MVWSPGHLKAHLAIIDQHCLVTFLGKDPLSQFKDRMVIINDEHGLICIGRSCHRRGRNHRTLFRRHIIIMLEFHNVGF